MVESKRQIQSRDPFDRFDEAINDPRLYETQEYETREYGQGISLQYQGPEDPPPHEPVPLFLSDYEDEPRHRFGSGGDIRERNVSRTIVWSRILKGGIAAAAAAGIALAIMSMENPLSVFANAKASLGAAAPFQFGAAEPARPPQNAMAQLTDPEPPATPDITPPRQIQPAEQASVPPSRDEITAAYQGALKSRVAAIEPPTQAVPTQAPPPPVARRIDPDELAALLTRAKGLLAIGDITAARLLLERAADAGEVEAALTLAGTYDPQVLGTQDMRSITPDPAKARRWYQKAAELGSPDARRHLGQLQN
jgi:hypothetical protein